MRTIGWMMVALLVVGMVTQAAAQQKNVNVTFDNQNQSFKADPVTKGTGAQETEEVVEEYQIGINDVLEISVLEPEEILRVVNVAPDGSVSFPYIGTIRVKNKTITEVQGMVRNALSDGYLKYPVVQVSLQESRSRQYLVYGEVNQPGAYPISEYSTVLRAISMAGGFTKFGNSSRVKILRPKENAPGYETIKIDIKKVMNGDSSEDVLLKAGDMVVVSEGVF